MPKILFAFAWLFFVFVPTSSPVSEDWEEKPILHVDKVDPPPTEPTLVLQKVIGGQIQPKSVSHSGTGRFFAQNMMYRHTVTVYDRNYNLIKTISDKVRLADYNITGYTGWHKGSPVECAFSPDGKYAWISNYKMYGAGFDNPGTDDCNRSPEYDHSYLYKVNTQTLEIEKIIPVGGVPKYVAVTPDGSLVLVSNWCTGDLSIVDTELGAEVHRVPLGRYPRGIVVDSKSRYAYVCMMGMARLAKIKLSDYSKEWITDIGVTPRHACISPDDRYLYLSLNRAGKLVKLDLTKNEIVASVQTGDQPRSMVLTPEGKYLYVGNYKDHTVSKVDAESFKELEEAPTNEKPIGITFDPETGNVWVACYSGSIMVYEDTEYEKPSSLTESVPLQTPLTPEPKNQNRGNSYLDFQEEQEQAGKSHQFIRRNDDNFKRSGSDSHRPRNIPERNSPAPQRKSSASSLSLPSFHYYIIVGSYGDRTNALSRSKELQSFGYQSDILKGKSGFRVSCGKYSSRVKASEALSELRSKYKDAWILQR
ncbi:MAG: beta-propeller fold lactonase family protein [Bacteroidota bacterium]